MYIALTLVLYTTISLCSAKLFSVACNNNKKTTRRWALFFAILIPALLAGLRGGSVGNDTGMYISEYYSPGSFAFGSGFRRTFEIGFRILREILVTLHLPHQVYFFVVQAATLAFLFAAAKAESEEIDIQVTMFIYMFDAYFQSFNMMRQALAVAIVIYAYTQVARDKIIKGIVFIALAGLFHRSAWIILTIVIVKYFFKSKRARGYIVLALCGTVLIMLNNNLLQKVAYFFLGQKAIWYTTRSDTGSKLWVYLLKLSPLIILMILCIRNFFKQNRRVVFYAGVVLVGYILGSYGNFVATDAQRIALYFTRLDAIVIGFAVTKGLTLFNREGFKPRDIKSFVYIYYIIMYLYNYFYLGVSDIVPYSIY